MKQMFLIIMTLLFFGCNRYYIVCVNQPIKNPMHTKMIDHVEMLNDNNNIFKTFYDSSGKCKCLTPETFKDLPDSVRNKLGTIKANLDPIYTLINN